MTTDLKSESYYKKKLKLLKKQWERYKWKVIRYYLGEEELLSLKNLRQI